MNLLAYISRQFLKDKNVYRYRMKKVLEMTDDEVISCCHWYCEENDLIKEWNTYREKIESQYCYCSYLEQYIDNSFCYNLQMIAGGFIKPSAIPEITIDKVKCSEHCFDCEHSL